MADGAPDLGDRVLVLAPTARDGVATRDLLAGAGIRSHLCATIADVCQEAALGAGAALVTAEAVVGDAGGQFAGLLGAQPRWSDLPVIVLTPPGPDSPRLLQALETVGSTTLMKRPVQVSTLVSAVRGALRDRRRQYEVRALLAERERAAEALRLERERYRVTLSSIGDAVIATDAGGGVTFLNPVAEGLTGWSAAEAAGRPLTDVFRIANEATRREVENPALRALASGVIVGLANHTVLIARDGTERPIDDSAAPIREDGAVSGAVLVFRDITERKRAEESRARLAAIVESSDDAIIGKTLDGVIRFWNAGAERVFGYSAAEAVGQSITLIIPPDRLDEEREILGRLRVGERIEHFETVRVTKDGRPVDISLTVSPIRDAHGTIIGASKVARDVTSRKRAEEALRAERERSEFVRRATGVGFWYCDLPFDELEWDEQVKEHFWLPPDARVTIGTFYDRIHPDDRGPTRAAIEQSVAGRDGYDAVYRTVDPGTGNQRWVRAIGRTFCDAAGAPRRFDGVTLDVTEQRRAEAALRASEGLLRLATEAAELGVWVWDVEADRVTWKNDRPYEIFGLDDSAGAVNAARFRDEFVHPDDAGLFSHAVAEAIRTGERFYFEGRLRRADEEVRWVEFRGLPLRTGGMPLRMHGTAADITERKRAENRLRESEERFRLMADAVPVLIWVSDQTKGCTWFNKTWLNFSGRTPQELVGNGWADDVHPDDLDRCLGIYVTNFDARRPFTMEYRLKRHDGEYRWVEDNGLPRYDGDGAFAGYIGSCVDFTERKVAEEALRRLAADLSEADRKKDDFIALLAHELRNPLAPIRNGLQVLRLSRDSATRERSQAMMDRQLTHMVRMIDDLLDVSRIGRNKMELRRERVALTDVVNSAVETARPAIEEAGHELRVSLPPHPVFLDADLTRLSQVLSNLLTNSAKYTERGGTIILSAESNGGAAVVSVRDNGIGIPARALPTIFDMFSQVDRPIERSTGGLGIGLALVKGLVEMHGGTVEARSEGEGRGSMFTVTLPTVADEEPVADAPGDGQATAGRVRRVLVVDDNHDGAESMADMLRLLGHQVHTAHDGLEAVEQAERFRPEVILMDIGMPVLNGLEATQRIRERPWGRGVAIIALTGWGQDGDRERSREAGCDGHLVKPVDLADLARALTDLADG